MNTIQKITKNVSILLISQMLGYVLGFFTLMFSARYLGVKGFGTISLALALTSIFSVFMDMGLSYLSIRDIARDKSIVKERISSIISIKIVLSIITICLICITGNILNYDSQTMQVIYIILLYMIFTSFTSLFYSVFQAHEKMGYQAFGTLVINILLLSSVFLAIYYKFDIIQFSLIYVISSVFVFCYSILVYVKNYSLSLNVNMPKWKSLITESWPFAITGISMSVYLWIDTIILSVIQGQEAVGLYNAAYKLTTVLTFIPLVFSNAIFPLMSQYYIASKESLYLTFEKLFKIMIIIGIPIGFGTTVIAGKVILLIYGEQYIGAVIALQILIWSTVIIFTRIPFVNLLESSNRQLKVTKAFLIALIINFVLNIVIIPRYSYIGAGVITVITDAIVLGIFILDIKNMGFLISKNIGKTILKVLLSSTLMGIIMYSLSYLNLIVLILIGIISYIFTLIFLKTFNQHEIKMIKSIFNR